ncbi:hypothetical protein RFI_14460 [Reticulomyxa filosa]|uniref:TRAF-type domain-containing protein n=1 Tax=Reticulomyxa filosa TaxID=46433 RepID=X6N9Z9_RETFI|nr:hypothetical protein RFI_14460 [Reticulomyxa filosa]|eukprot:ETO22733.1 hypothetical protein RFI_14460 [Reticulomyxa filosa]
MEINCPQHKDMDESLIIGENCLKQFLSQNPDSCPVTPHKNCLYSQNRLAKRYIGELLVTCARQFEQKDDQENKVEDTSVPLCCDFKGTIKQVDDHLENACCLKSVKCWFESFGCDDTCAKSTLRDHLASAMKFHFDLVMKSFEALKQTIQQQQVFQIFFFFFLYILDTRIKVGKCNTQIGGAIERRRDCTFETKARTISLFSSLFVCLFKTTLLEMEKLKQETLSAKAINNSKNPSVSGGRKATAPVSGQKKSATNKQKIYPRKKTLAILVALTMEEPLLVVLMTLIMVMGDTMVMEEALMAVDTTEEIRKIYKQHFSLFCFLLVILSIGEIQTYLHFDLAYLYLSKGNIFF